MSAHPRYEPPSARYAGRRAPSPVTLADLTADLVWTSLLRVGRLALRPQRLGLAFVFLIGLVLLLALADKLDGDKDHFGLQESAEVVAGNTLAAAGAHGDRQDVKIGSNLFSTYVATPGYLALKYPWVAFLAVPLMLLWTGLCAGAISRSAACDFAHGVSITWPQAVGFALGRWLRLALVLVLPLLMVWGIALGLAVAGWALFSLQVVNLLGGLLWPVFLVGGLVASLAILGFVFGWPLLVPGVTCENADALDAVQHAYAMVFARPLRLVVYLAILVVQFVVLGTIVAVVLWLAVHIAQMCGMQWSGWRGNDVLGAIPQHGLSTAPDEARGTAKGARALVNLWSVIPVSLPVAFVVSFIWSGSTVLFLAMRRIVDGQDMSEIWMPGVIPGTMARASDVPPPIPQTQAQTVSDTGPADES